MKEYIRNTIDYYNINADEYINNTYDCDMNELYKPFLAYLNKGAKILDLGCGTGRDSKAFLSMGYDMIAVDGSAKLTEFARESINSSVRCIPFTKLDYTEEFDGVWACASLLHISKEDLPEVISKIGESLKDDGVFYTSFKYGNIEYIKDDRSFSNYDEKSIKEILNDKSGFKIMEISITKDVRKNREDDKWLNVIAVKI